MRGHDWQAIRDAYPLSGVVGQAGVKLRKAGREWSACCPFHNEKTASFYVNDDKQFYHCFGCSAHGDVVDFVAQTQRIEPADAVARLTGGNIPRLTEGDRAERDEWLARKAKEREAEQRQATAKAQQRWDRANRLDGPNTYLEHKGIAPYGCRVEGENILLPIYGADGEIMSVQTIAPDGSKRFQPDAPVMGGRMNIGIFSGRTILCEGFATGHSIYEARVDQVCVTFSKANMAVIARELVEAGVHIVLAADANARDEMNALGMELGVPVVVAPDLGPRKNDFNDQAQEQGLDAVRETIAQGLIDWANRPPPPAEAPFCAISFVEAFDFDEAAIPPRNWIVKGAVLAAYTHMLAAPGGTGKSLFTLQMAIMLATGMEWNGWVPRGKCNVLIINAEDDIDEQRRRLAAARRQMGIDSADIGRRIMIADSPSSILVSANDPKSRVPLATPLVEQLVAVIRHYAIDVVIVDPFAETFDGDENSNGDTKWAMKTWRDDIARATGAAVYLVHHTTKNAGDKAGSTDVIRGASALVNSVRIAATLFVMTTAEAAALGVPAEKRMDYVRYDDAKSNQSLVGHRRWFRKVSVRIGNGDEDTADEVGALEPHEFSTPLPMYDQTMLLEALEAVNDGPVDEDGVVDDLPFGMSRKGGSKRWVGYMFMRRMGISADDAKALVKRMTDAGVLQSYTLDDPSKGRMAEAARADMVAAYRLFEVTPNEI